MAGIAVEVRKLEQGPPVGKEIEIQLASRERALLEPAATKIRAHLDSLEKLRDVEDTRSLPGIEWRLDVDRARAAEVGANVAVVGGVVQMLTGGIKVGEFRPDDAEDEVDIRVRFPADARGLDAISELRVATLSGQVPISSFVRQVPSPRVDQTQRQDGIPVEFVRADVQDGVLASDMVREIDAWLATQAFDPRVTITFKGSNEEQNDAIAFVQMAFVLSLLLMFILLVAQFNSFYQTALILFAVVMSTAGVLFGLVITGDPFSAIMTGIAIVALAGIVVNNNIILIDTYNHLRREHRDLGYVDLIVRTGAQRLRPVMLTTLTTGLGLLPLASHLSVDFINRSVVYGGQVSTFWVPLSRSIVFGLTFATLLTLVATPALLALPHQIRGLVARVRQRAAARRPAPAAPADVTPAPGAIIAER